MTKEQKHKLCEMFGAYGVLTAKEENVRHNDFYTDSQKEEVIKMLQEEQQKVTQEFVELLNEV